MKSKQDIAELEFLSILYSKTDIALDLLQIKPKYLFNKIHQKIFKLILESYEKQSIVDYSYIADKLFEGVELTSMTDIVSEEYLPLVNIKNHFMSVQTIILNNYKKEVIKNITTKFNSGQLTVDEYLKKMEKIQNIQIQEKGIYLTEEEITSSINVEKVRIPLKKYTQLDKILELVQNDFLVIGANTGTGKSSLLLNIMDDLMEDYQCIYFNLEMSKSTIYKRMVAIRGNVPVNAVTSPQDHQKDLVDEAIEYITSQDVCVEHKLSDLEDIEFYIKMMKNEKGKHTIVFLDHLGLIRTKNAKSLYEKITEIAKSLRQICLKYDCTIISACQLNRSSYGSEKLDLSMLKDSGEIENSASKIILLYRNKEYSSDCLEPEMMLNICKNRDGMLGEISLMYDKTKQIFKERSYADR